MSDLQDLIDAVRSETRRDILNLIWNRSRTVGEIAAEFDLRPPTISQHLKVLRDAGLVTRVTDGNFRHYVANQDALQTLRSALPAQPTRWLPADDIPETEHADAKTMRVVTATVEVPTDQATTFRAFTDDTVYTRWLGVPVSIVAGRFSATLEWGTRIRGRYEVQAPPHLIALAWDFEDDNVPVPGDEMIGYIRFGGLGTGCRVDVHQLCPTGEAADFMEVAWALVLGRLRDGIEAAVDASVEAPRRTPRPKRFSAD